MSHDDPRWGAENRDSKAANIVECIQLVTGRQLDRLHCVDVGCGSGGISFHLAPHFASVRGVDPEPWDRWQDFSEQRDNLSFHEGSAEDLRIDDDSVDVVICNQVYEHVPSPQQLIAEINRIMKPDGICYFAGPNLLYPIEPHVFWPFVHWIPRPWALAILRRFAPDKVRDMDAYSTTYWTLRRWLGAFRIVDAVPALIKHRAASGGRIWRLFRPIPQPVLRWFGFLSPGFVFVLTKPDGA